MYPSKLSWIKLKPSKYIKKSVIVDKISNLINELAILPLMKKGIAQYTKTQIKKETERRLASLQPLI